MNSFACDPSPHKMIDHIVDKVSLFDCQGEQMLLRNYNYRPMQAASAVRWEQDKDTITRIHSLRVVSVMSLYHN